MAPGTHGWCAAALDFYAPRPVEQATSLAFDVKTAGGRMAYFFELSDGTKETEADPARSGIYHAAGDWESDGLRFSRLKNDWAPEQITTIRVVLSPRKRHNAKNAALLIRDLRFAGNRVAETPIEPVVVAMEEPGVMDDTSAAAEPFDLSPEPSPAAVALEAPAATPGPVKTRPSLGERWVALLSSLHHRLVVLWSSIKADVSLLFSYRPHWTFKTGRWVLGLGGVWLLAGLASVRRRKSVTPLAFGPLFEMNTRVWKSEKDEDGVLHVAGFNRITLGDLKTIKASGFNSLWLMGIWEIGGKVRDISRRYGSDFAGSPFAISDYAISSELGNEEEFSALLERAHSVGLRVIVDFVPNHMGLDSEWLNRNPEFFIHRVLGPDEEFLPVSELENRYPGHFVYRTPAYPEGGHRVPKTILVAYGKDPYFYPWIDTAQLDYANPALRRKMTDVLCLMAEKVDGVRCDMAMLVLREQIKIHRHPEMSWEEFNRWMPGEFWSEAIQAAKQVNPNFTFIAETYWAMEGYLQQLGFDYTYNKPLYEAMCGAFHQGNAEGLMNFLRMLGTEFLSKGVHFLENHDEERAMNALGPDRQRGAAVMLCTLPGVALIHQGQMEGKRERLPVQRVVPLHEEIPNDSLQTFYEKLLAVTQRPLFREGRLHVLYSNNASLITYARTDGDEKAVVIINTSGRHQQGTVSLMPALRLKTGHPFKLRDLFYGLKTSEIRRKAGVKPHYVYPAPQLINQGIYVELEPYDAHIFLLEPTAARELATRVQKTLVHFQEESPLPRVARKVMGSTLLKSSERSLTGPGHRRR